MRSLVALLIVLSVLYFWDVEHKNRTLSDGSRSMGRSISHSMGRYPSPPNRGGFGLLIC
jgi:hypothetical protein